MQPMSFEAATIVEDWVTGIDTFLEDDTYLERKALYALSVNAMLLRPSSDEMEELGAGNNCCFLDMIISPKMFLSFSLFIYLFDRFLQVLMIMRFSIQ